MTHEVNTFVTYEDCECGGEFTEVDHSTAEVINKEVMIESICNKCGKRKLGNYAHFGKLTYHYLKE